MDDNFLKKFVFSRQVKYIITRHFLFWVIMIFYFSAFLRAGVNFWELFKSNMLFIPLDMCTTYIVIYLIFPKLLKGGKQLIVSILLFIIVISFHIYLAHLLEKTFIRNFTPLSEISFFTWFLQSTRILFIIILAALFIKSIKYLYLKDISYRELEKKNIENKMTLLTSQLHPHFLFNTLNNLYMLSKEKSDKLPDMIMGLSEVMRYITDDQRSKVELCKELDIINSYIAIEKIRYNDNLIVEKEINLSENQKKSTFIPPLLIFTFVENAFKHGVSKSIDNPWISIKIGILNSTLKIEIENSVDRLFEKKQKRQGIGLKNVTSRLNLYYPNKYKYSIRKTDIKYYVELELNLQR